MVKQIMSTASDRELAKKPIRYLEIPINKFNDEAIPHHLEQLKKHKNNIKKVSCQISNLKLTLRVLIQFFLLVSKYQELGWSLHGAN